MYVVHCCLEAPSQQVLALYFIWDSVVLRHQHNNLICMIYISIRRVHDIHSRYVIPAAPAAPWLWSSRSSSFGLLRIPVQNLAFPGLDPGSVSARVWICLSLVLHAHVPANVIWCDLFRPGYVRMQVHAPPQFYLICLGLVLHVHVPPYFCVIV